MSEEAWWLTPASVSIEIARSLTHCHPVLSCRTHTHTHKSGVNDSAADAHRLARMTEGLDCVVNVIQFNSHDGAIFRGSPRERVRLFVVRVVVLCVASS